MGKRPRWPPRVGNSHCSFPRPPSWPLRERSKESRGLVIFLLAFSLSFPLLFLWCALTTTFGAGLGAGQRGACNGPPSDLIEVGTGSGQEMDSLFHLAMI